MKKRGQGKRRRIIAAFLCLCVLFTTQPEIWNRLSVFAAEESDTKVILSFAELSEEIKEQTVPVGTVYEELELPEELNVYMKQTEIFSTPNLAEEKSEEGTVSGNDMEIGSTEEGEDAAEQEEYYVEQEETIVYAPENSEQEAQELQGVTWQSDPAYGSNTEETYIFTAVLPEGYTLAENVCLPQITVTVIESESGIDFVMQDLSDRIATLPDAEEYLASEPDMDDEDSYVEWEEKMYAYAEDALDIWEDYEVLPREQHTQITEEELAKLTAWVELAETLEESSQVMEADDTQHKHCVCGGNINIGDHTTHTEDIVYDNILASNNGQLLINGAPQSDYTLTSGNYYLDEDVALSSELVIAKGSEVYICLNNRTLSYDRTSGKHRVITVEEGGATLNLCTCGDSGRIMGGDSDNRAGGLYLSNNSIFYMYGGSIEGNSAATSGGGIYSGDSVLCNLYSTYICNNKGNIGAGISFSGILNIYGGEIKNNEAANYGGGIAAGGTAKECIWQDIIISNNTAEKYAGGLFCGSPNANLIMSDIEISNNIVSNSTARYPAGGVALMQGTISISGAIIISGNQYNGSPNNLCNTNANPNDPGELFIAGTLDEQSVIGLTNKNVPTEEKPDPVEVASGNNHTISPADWSRFFSDDDTYEILLDKTNNRLLLSYSGSCDLFTLSTSGATLSPEFEADITEYTSTVANSVDEVGITATLADTALGADITIKINDGAETSMENGVPKTVDLVEGENTIVIIVTSGEMSKAYTIKITREEAKGYPVTITAYKDGVEWTGAPSGYRLTSDDGKTFLPGLAAPDGTYKIYIGDIDTGVEVTVTGAEVTARVDYYTVTFYDGTTELTAPAQQIVLKGAAASVPTDNPTKTGYTFSKWVTADGGSTAYDFTKAVTGKTLLYANWTPNTYQVTFEYHGADGGNTTASKNVAYDSKYGELPMPSKRGYTFKGWYTEADGQGSEVNADMVVTKTSDHTLHAWWKDGTSPDKPALQDGETLPADWTNNQTAIPLKLYDGVGVTELWVSIDGKGYTKVDSFTPGTGSMTYNYTPVLEGEHTYQFKAKDAAHNVSEESVVFTIKLDQKKPVIGTLTYENKAKDFLDWIIGKKSMIVHVPVTDEGSGVEKISYTLTPRNADGALDVSSAETKTAAVKDGGGGRNHI